MERYEAYQPPDKKGFYLDPRTKVLFMAFVTTLMFFVYENLAMDAVVAIIPLTLLLINRQAVCPGGCSKTDTGDVCTSVRPKHDFCAAGRNGNPSVSNFHVGLLHY